MSKSSWRIRLGAEAEKDFVRILKYTSDNFGPQQGRTYKATLIEALAALEAGPNLPGSVARDELQPGLRSLHVARHGRRGRHLILYRASMNDVVEIVRILHDAMDFARHIPTSAQ